MSLDELDEVKEKQMKHTPPTYYTALEQAKENRRTLVRAMVETFPLGCQIRTEDRPDVMLLVVGHWRYSCKLIVEHEGQRTRDVLPGQVTHRKLLGGSWESVRDGAQQCRLDAMDEEVEEEQADEQKREMTLDEKLRAEYVRGFSDVRRMILTLQCQKMEGSPSETFLRELYRAMDYLRDSWKPATTTDEETT